MHLVCLKVSLNNARQIKLVTNIILNIRQQFFIIVSDGFIHKNISYIKTVKFCRFLYNKIKIYVHLLKRRNKTYINSV